MTIRSKGNRGIFIPRSTVLDAHLGLEVLGFLVYLLSLPDHGDLSATKIMKKTGLSRATIYRYIHILEAAGYIGKRDVVRKGGGKFANAKPYTLYDKAQIVRRRFPKK